MCTIVLAHDVVEGVPLLLGANRDERFDRPAAPPERIDNGSIQLVAPRDLEAGGTWLGINEAGVLAAITNRFGANFGGDRRSRGELVFRALEHDTASEAAEDLARLDPTDYNGFHLVIASADDTRLVWGDGQRMVSSRLPRGAITVLTERSLGAARNERKRRVKRQVSQLALREELGVQTLEQLLAERDDGSMDATCVVMNGINYGTRSSTIVGLGEAPLMHFADGPPCETPYDDRSDLLVDLF